MSSNRGPFDDFEEICVLGKGSFGTVSKVLRKVDGQFYVIKRILITELSRDEQTNSINEVKLLAQMNSKYVVRYLESFIHGKELCIVMEYCDKGDLQNLIKRAKSRNMTCIKEDVTWNIILQVILGLYYLHSKKVLHRDLKSANVFLKKPTEKRLFYDVKIGDLGVSKLLEVILILVLSYAESHSIIVYLFHYADFYSCIIFLLILFFENIISHIVIFISLSHFNNIIISVLLLYLFDYFMNIVQHSLCANNCGYTLLFVT